MCAHHTQAVTEPPVKFPAYGYLHIPENLKDDELQKSQCGLEKLAEVEGFHFIEIVSDPQAECYSTFYRLTAELKRAPVRHMAAPWLDHLSTHPLLLEQSLLRLNEANVRVWPGETVNDADCHLLLLLGSLGNGVADIITGIFEDSLSRNEQLAYVGEAAELAEEFRQRVHRTFFALGAETA